MYNELKYKRIYLKKKKNLYKKNLVWKCCCISCSIFNDVELFLIFGKFRLKIVDLKMVGMEGVCREFDIFDCVDKIIIEINRKLLNEIIVFRG